MFWLGKTKKILKRLLDYEPDYNWLAQNKQQLLRYLAQNEVRRFRVFEISEIKSKPKLTSFWLDFFELRKKFIFQTKPSLVVLLVLIFLVFAGGGITLAAQKSQPGSFVYPVKLATENFTCQLTLNKVKRLNCLIKQAENRLKEIQTMLEMRGIGENREILETTLRNYLKKLTKAQYSFYQLAVEEKNYQNIFDAAKNLEQKADAHQLIIKEVKKEANTNNLQELEDLTNLAKDAENAAIAVSSEASKQELRVEAATNVTMNNKEGEAVKNLEKDIAYAVTMTGEFDSKLEAIRLTQGTLVLSEPSRLLSLARQALFEAQRLYEQKRYVEAVDQMRYFFQTAVELEDLLKTLAPELYLKE